MDELTKKQIEVGEQVSKLLDNVRKEPKERRTEEVITKRYQQLENLWTEFQARHDKISALNQPEHQYHTKAYYDQVKQATKKIEDMLATYKAALTNKSTIANDESGHSKVEFKLSATDSKNENNLRHKRERLRIAAFAEQLMQVNNDQELNSTRIEFYIRILSEHWKNIQELHEEVLLYCKEEDYKEEEMQELIELYKQEQQNYNKTIILLQDKNISIQSRPSENDIRLPRLTIPTFDGKYET